MCFLIKTRFLFVFFLFYNLIYGLQYLIVVTNVNDTICYDDKDECEWSFVSETASSPHDRVPLNFSFPLYQETFNRLFISPNGYVHFKAEYDCDGDINLMNGCQIDRNSFDMSIAGILTDFDPILYDYSNVYRYSDDERFEVLYDKVRINQLNVNFTFSISLFPNGVVQISYHDIPAYEDIIGFLPDHLVNENKYFYYSGVIGSLYKITPQTYERDESRFKYGINVHYQIDLTPYRSFRENNTILFCPMAEKLCVSPYFIDTFEGGEVHITGDILSCENELSFICLLSVTAMETITVEAKYANNEIICKIPPFSKFKRNIKSKNKNNNNNNKTMDYENKNKRINEPNTIYIHLKYLATYETILGSEYFDYVTNNQLTAAYIDFDDREENYTSISCDDSDINVCDKCGICGGDNECIICDNKTLYYTDCDSNCTNEEEYYDGECVSKDLFDCFGIYNGKAVVSKNGVGKGFQCCLGKIDCYGSCAGSAVYDKCNNCVGGATGKTYEDSLDCYAVCNGTRMPPCNSTIEYDDSDIIIEREISDDEFIDTVIPFDGFINGTAAVKFTRVFVYPQMPYYPRFDVYFYNGKEYLPISTYYDSDSEYLVPNGTVYFRLKAITSRLNSYAPKSVERHKININYLPIKNKDEQRMSFDVYIRYKNCERRKGYEQCYLPGCFFCVGNEGFNVATEAKIINGVCVDGNISTCQKLISKSNDGFLYVFCNLWIVMIVIFIL